MSKWKDDMKPPGYEPELYVPKANVDHTISDQRTAVSTLDHSATKPRAIPHMFCIETNVPAFWDLI